MYSPFFPTVLLIHLCPGFSYPFLTPNIECSIQDASFVFLSEKIFEVEYFFKHSLPLFSYIFFFFLSDLLAILNAIATA